MAYTAAGGAVEKLQGQGAGADRLAQGVVKAVVARPIFATGQCHGDHPPIGRKQQSAIGIGRTHQGEMLEI